MPKPEMNWAVAILVLSVVGLLYALAQAFGYVGALSGVTDTTLAFLSIVGIAIGAYFSGD